MESAKKIREVYKGKFTRAENSLLEILESDPGIKHIVEKRFETLKEPGRIHKRNVNRMLVCYRMIS